MKIKFGARCIGMNEAEEEIFEFDDNTDDKKIEEALSDFAVDATHFEKWFYKCDDNGNKI